MEDKVKSFFQSLAPMGIILGVQMGVSFIAIQFLVCFEAFTFQGNTYMEYLQQNLNVFRSPDFTVGISAIYAAVCVLIFGIWYVREFLPKRQGKRISLVKTMTKYHPVMIPGMLIFVVGLQYFCVYFMNALAMFFPKWLAVYQKLMETSGIASEDHSLLLIMYTVILGPICEELAFRGLTLEFGRRAMPFWAANILQALMFGFLHMNLLQGCYTFVMALLLGYIVYRTGNILISIILHILFNAYAMFLSQFTFLGNTPISFFLLLLLGMVATYAGVELIVKAAGKKVNKTTGATDINSTMP